ncbi:MAG: AAA family ATPase [Candidatus Aenigmarchaeota archaeon]|nr:AAA family ATPase [Candidatus Aenigmarchaeota archaeon]
MNIFSETHESRIFKNEEVLSPEYLPEFLPHREDKIKEIARNLMPVARGAKGQNTFIFGPPGIGKTHVVKFVFREFEDFSENVKTIYINCWEYNTSLAVLTKIANELEIFVPRRGISKDEVLERLVEFLDKTKKGLVVCLDEVDQLIFKTQEVLYDLLRINQYLKNPVCLIFISNFKDVFVNLDPRIKSSLRVEEIEFKPYTVQEMKDILEERIRYAFHSAEEGVAILVANFAVQKGSDVRIGLECLLRAGRLAESENSDKLKVSHVKKVLPEVEPVKPKILEESVSENEKVILEILKEKKSLTSGELYKEYCKKSEKPVSDRAFRDLINHLLQVKLIKVKEVKKGIKGRTRIISIFS